LHRVFRAVVVLQRPTRVNRNGEHSNVLTGTVVLKYVRRPAFQTQLPGDLKTVRLVNAALQRFGTETNLVQHRSATS
jgi:hypothetical protein